MPEPHEFCRDCDAVVEPQREGEPYSCYRGGDDKPLVELASDENGHPLRSAACLAANPPLLTREEFLAAVRERCEDDELVLTNRALGSIGRFRLYRDRHTGTLFIRLLDAFAAIPIQPYPTGGDVAFIDEAKWGPTAIERAETALFIARHDLESLQRILAGLGEPGPGQTD